MPKHNITRSNTATQPLCYCTRSHPQTTVFPCNISLICSSEQRLVKGQLQIKLQNIVAIPKHICCIIMFINRPAFWHHKVLQVSGHWAQIDCDVMSKMLSIYCNNNTHVSIVCLCSCDTEIASMRQTLSTWPWSPNTPWDAGSESDPDILNSST